LIKALKGVTGVAAENGVFLEEQHKASVIQVVNVGLDSAAIVVDQGTQIPGQTRAEHLKLA
jgi:hypothetical protein